jgi:hypothetical protein
MQADRPVSGPETRAPFDQNRPRTHSPQTAYVEISQFLNIAWDFSYLLVAAASERKVDDADDDFAD